MMLRDLSFEFCKPFLCTVTTFVTLMSAPSLTLAQQPSAAPQSPNPQAQSQVMTTTTTEQEPAQKMPPEQLDSLVAPIALFPDPLLATSLAASTYPLEIIQLQQWMERNKNLKDKALADAVAKQPWDPSVQSLAVTPDVVQRLAGNIQWTTDLGNAFLAQQSDVMEAVQRMRAKAQGTGNLKTSAQQTVETKTEGGKQVIVVEPSSIRRSLRSLIRLDGGLWTSSPCLSLLPLYLSGILPGHGAGVGRGRICAGCLGRRSLGQLQLGQR